MRILLVDDDPMVRRMLRRVIEKKTAFTVVGEARNGAEAVDAARHLSPEVVVIDVDMPVMDGLEAARRITTSHRDIRVLVFTSANCSDTRNRLNGTGVTCVIRKDQSAELIDRLNTIAEPTIPRRATARPRDQSK